MSPDRPDWTPDARESNAQTAYAVRRAGLIEELELHGHSVAFWTRTTGSGHLVRMGCKNCWRTYRGPFHRWWGLSPRRPCPNPSRPG